MNKLLIVLLAVCLVSAHAFVKRDAPAAADNKNFLETIQKQIEDFGKTVNTEVADAFDPDTIKEQLNQFVNIVSKMVDEMTAARQAKAA